MQECINDVIIRIFSIEGGVAKEGIQCDRTVLCDAGGNRAAMTILSQKEIAKDFELSHEEIRRYGRHLILPEVALDGQKRLKSAKIIIVGAGGLGSPLALYLAAAGVGTLGLVDFDVVDHSNLQRQIIHTTADVGRPKIQSAGARITAINPNVIVETFETKLSSANALELFRDFDVIVDGTDNFPSRYLINDACVLLGKPNIYGSIYRFQGQVSVLSTNNGPCYRCLYPEPPPPSLVPSCSEGGVLGVLPGIIGTIQGVEALKLILGIGESLVGRLLLFNALKMQFREVTFGRNPACPMCGDDPTIKELMDYEVFCGIAPDQTEAVRSSNEITVQELHERLSPGDDLFLLDVREPHEYQIVNIGGHLIPLGELPRRLDELDSSKEIAVLCHHGVRSRQAVEFLRQSGFRKVRNVVGGIDRWALELDKTLPRY